MKINEIYKCFEDSPKDIVSLSKKEIMVVPLLIDIMTCKDNSNALWAEKQILEISKKYPELVAPFIGYIFQNEDNNKKMLNNDFIILSQVIEFDYSNKWDEINISYYKALSSKYIIEFSYAIKIAPKIILAKPKEKPFILKFIDDAKERDFFACEDDTEKSSVCKNIAMQKINEFYIACEN